MRKILLLCLCCILVGCGQEGKQDDVQQTRESQLQTPSADPGKVASPAAEVQQNPAGNSEAEPDDAAPAGDGAEQAAAGGYDSRPVELKTLKQRVSYSFGLELGNYYRKQLMNIDPQIFVLGMLHAQEGGQRLMSEAEVKAAVEEYNKKHVDELNKERRQLATKNKTAAEKFLAENAKRPGVITTKSGLQYKILKEGTGPSPGAEDLVEVHYHGTLLNGTTFDSSRDKGAPQIFKMSNVIKGWAEGMKLSKQGGQYMFWIPPDLGYGEYGGVKVEPNSLLTFEVEILRVNPNL